MKSTNCEAGLKMNNRNLTTTTFNLAKRRGRRVLAAGTIVVLALLSNVTAFAQGDRYEGRTVTGTVYFIGGRTAGRSLSFRLIINRLTTPQEVSELNAALQEGGQDALMRTLSRQDAGRIQIG